LPSSTIAFASGKLAMYFGFSWDVFEIKEINPKLNFRVMPVPQLTENQVNWASFWVEGVSLKSKNKPEAWAFLQYLSQPEVLRKLYQQQGQFRLFGEPYARKDMAAEISTNPLVAPFVAQASQAQTWYLCSRTFDNGLNDRMIRYFEDAVNAVSLQNKSASDALKTVSAGVSQQLSRYQVPASF
jgi:ABC-type glycerol-3-phosphate transport system substrate-binding protein